MPLAAAPLHKNSGRRTVSYRTTTGRTYSASLTSVSAWKANASLNYDLITSVTLTINGTNVVTVDTTAATDLATMITTLNGNGTFAAAATAADSTTTPGRLLVSADAAGPQNISLSGVGGLAGVVVGQLRFYEPTSTGRNLISEVPAATTVKSTNAYFYRFGPKLP